MTQPRRSLFSPPPGKPANVVVGMGDLGAATGNGEVVTHALGSCIAVCLHDARVHVAVMLHFMLPDSSVDANRAASQPMAFGDLGVPAALALAERQGATRRTLVAKLVGGASIPGAPARFEIGKRNILCARKMLWQVGVRLAAQEVGGTISRTVHMSASNGVLVVTTPGQPPRQL